MQPPAEPEYAAASRLLFDASKVMIPVVTGFLTLFFGTLNSRTLLERSRLAFWAAILGIAGLGLWSGVLAFSIQSFEYVNASACEILWLVPVKNCGKLAFEAGQWSARIGHLAFFAAVGCAVFFFLKRPRSHIPQHDRH